HPRRPRHLGHQPPPPGARERGRTGLGVTRRTGGSMKGQMRVRLVYAVLAGAAADLAGLGLIAAAAWLITRAAEQPPLAPLTVAIVATRAFATGRGVFRYAGRLTGHDLALPSRADTRERLCEELVRR